MKILYILGAYRPNMSANGLCSDNVIKALVEAGHKVTVLANATVGYPKERTEDGIEIITVKPKAIIYMTEKSQQLAESRPLCSKILRLMGLFINKLQLFVSSPFWPICSPGYTRRFYKKACDLHRKNDYDAVVSAYTPIDALLAGYKLKKKFPEIKYIPYYLDALAGGWGPKKWSQQRTERHTRRWERKIDKYADLVISMKSSEDYHNNNELFEGANIKRKYLDVPMFNPSETKPQTNTENEAKKFLYAGTIRYPHRNPLPILETLTKLAKECDIDATFAGECSTPELFEPFEKASGGKIKYIGKCSHKEIEELYEKTDYFINLGSINPNTISCKIFEYMAYKKPIIATYSIENEPTLTHLEKYKAAFFLDERRKDYKAMSEELRRFIQNNCFNEIDLDFLKKSFYCNTPEAFVDTLTNFIK